MPPNSSLSSLPLPPCLSWKVTPLRLPLLLALLRLTKILDRVGRVVWVECR